MHSRKRQNAVRQWEMMHVMKPPVRGGTLPRHTSRVIPIVRPSISSSPSHSLTFHFYGIEL
jgi:hypothetical protein